METSTAETISYERKQAIEVLQHFLVGRKKPYALQNQDGSYSVVRDHLTDNQLYKHLDGDITVGTYTIDENDECRCVVWDLDSGSFSQVLSLLAVLPSPSAVYESGRKGWHVVQSFEPRLHASLAHAYGIDRKRAAGLEHIESFPKQASISPDGLGNLTKLPLGIHRVTGQRAKLVWGAPGYAPQPTVLESYAPKATAVRGEQHDGFLQRLFNGDVGEGRNNSLNRFTYWLRARDFPEDLVRSNVLYVNGLFEEPLEEEELERTVLRPR